MPQPDRSINLTVRYTYKATVDEGTLHNIIGRNVGAGDDPISAAEMNKAFQIWKDRQVDIARSSFRAAHTLAADAVIDVQVT